MDMRAVSRSVRVRALALLIMGLAGFAIYAISCVYAPLSWSPDSSKIALSVMPVDTEPEILAIFVYDIKSDKRELIETTEGGILSGPAWSPDGKWLAYYRIRPDEEAAKNDPNGTATHVRTTRERPPAVGLFTEDNRVQPGFVFEACRDMVDEATDAKAFDVELVVVSPDGKERKVERALPWIMDNDDRGQVAMLKPRWSADSQRVFYMRAFDKMGYIGSLDITTGRTEAYAFTSSLYWDVSPDGAWVAARVDDTLSVSRVDGGDCRYRRVLTEDEELDAEDDRLLVWAPDSRRVCLGLKGGFVVVNVETGKAERYKDPIADEIAYQTFSADGTKVFYLAKYKPEDVNGGDRAAAIRQMDLAGGKAETVTLLPEIDADGENGLGSFSVSPSGRMFLVRGVVTDDAGKKSSCLIFWDGRKRRAVETDSWLSDLPLGVGL